MSLFETLKLIGSWDIIKLVNCSVVLCTKCNNDFFFSLYVHLFFCLILVDSLLRIYLRTTTWGLSVEWGGGGWAHEAGEIFELGEVNAHRMCVSATNKQ